MNNDRFRSLPSISALLSVPSCAALCSRFGEGVTKLVLRRLLKREREALAAGGREQAPLSDQLIKAAEAELMRIAAPEGRRAINGTGVLLHTGLGRAPLSAAAREALNEEGYSILQVDLDTGGRSLREERIEQYLRELTGCEAATVVNNNAAATHIVLNTLARGQEVIISRGQLIEIGGEFRMPDVMAASGALLHEVGTTNRTHLSDYERAINDRTGALLYVEPSNYKIEGFTGSPELRELGALAVTNSVPLIADLGSGALVPLERYGISGLLTIGEALRAGALVTCSSGDKLISGPQSGIICGRKDIVEAIRRNPFARMFRTSKLELVALEATLRAFVNGAHEQELPLYQALARSIAELQARAEELSAALQRIGVAAMVEDSSCFVGGGSVPGQGIPSKAVKIAAGKDAERLAAQLRGRTPSVFCRIKDRALIFDLRTLDSSELPLVIEALGDLSPTLTAA